MKFRKLLCFVLIFAIIMSLGVTAFADAIVPTTEICGYDIKNASISRVASSLGSTQADVINLIEKDIHTLDRCSIPISDTVNISYNSGRIEYVLYFPEINTTSTVCVTDSNSGNVIFDISEEDCHDILEVKADGAIFLNGNEVKFESTSTENATSSIVAPYARYDEYSARDYCPGASYSKSGSEVGHRITNGVDLIRKLAKLTIASLIGAAIGGIPGSVVRALFLSVAGDLKSTAEVYAPNSKVASFKLQKYEKSPQNTPLNMYYKYTGKYYATDNYKKYAGSSTYYRHNYFA